jgi:uncharacterized YkwD family protein
MQNKFITILLLCLMALLPIGCNGNNQNAAGLGEDARYFQDEANDMYLSSEATDIPSQNFPHTKPVKIQEAKFDFVIDDSQLHPREIYDLNQNLDSATLQERLRTLLRNNLPERQRPDQAAPEETEPQAPEPEQPEPAEEETPTPEPEPEEQPQAPEPQPEEAEEPEQDEPQEVTDGIRQEERQVVELTNNHRREAGLSDLQLDTELSAVARRKSTDMAQNNYFSHTSPTYGSPFDMIRDHGISYNAAGENIAQGQRSAEEVVQAWMDSPGHRENIMNGNYTHIGVGYDPSGHHWTQMFISR